MKYKTSIIIGMLSILTGFIPMSFKKEKNITYEIYSCNIQQANLIKKELLVFYKKYCYSFSYSAIARSAIASISSFVNEGKESVPGSEPADALRKNCSRTR